MKTRNKFRVKGCEETDGSAERKPSTICCLIPAVPPFPASLLALFFPLFCPTKSHRTESIYCQVSGDTRHRRNKSKPSLNLILFSRCYFFSLLVPFERAAMQISRSHTNGNAQIHTRVHTVCEKVSLMESEDSNFPSATKDRKPSELNYPCLTHIQTEHTHTHTYTLTPSLAIIGTHTSMHTLSCCDILENHTIRVTQVDCEEDLSKGDFM